MDDIYKNLKNSQFSIQVSTRTNGNNRASDGVEGILKKISNDTYLLSKTKTVFLQIISGNEEISITEIETIDTRLKEEIPDSVTIFLSMDEKDISNDIELKTIFTYLEYNDANIDIEEAFI